MGSTATAGAPTALAALRAPLVAVAPLLFGSGFCALVYQIAWQRELRLVFGASTAASAAVMAVFMGGLGLGGWILGRRADRSPNPLRLYALLELGVALSAAATPFLFPLLRRAYLGLGGTEALGPWAGTGVRLLLTAAALLPATFLAGGTLGAAARAVEANAGRRATAALYGMNTLGAVAGCLVPTFWALEALGTRQTVWGAAALNLLVALLALTVAARGTPEADAPDEVLPESASRSMVLAAAFVVGFSFLLMEVVWYRMLAPILGGTVYTFGLVLAVALAGIAAGGIAYAALARRITVSLGLFAGSCLLEAVALGAPFLADDGVALLALALRPMPGSLLAAYVPGWLLVTALVVLPASIVAGAQFPLLIALLGQGRGGVGRDVGVAYLWNTAGGIAGALAGGFWLLPLLSAPGCWRLSVLALCGLAVAAAFVDRRARPRDEPRTLVASTIAASTVAVLIVTATGPTAAWRHSGIGAGRAAKPAAWTPNAERSFIHDARRFVAWEKEGIESSVAVQNLAGLSFLLNGKTDGNARNDAPTQVMGGLLGALLRPGARQSLVVGLGTGSTAGWLAAVPEMERVDVLELEPVVLDVARECAPVNAGALANPRVVVTTGDARELLMSGRRRYGLVFSEPSNPYRAGVASLFTREFYAAVAARLEDDGVFLQWLQAYDVDEDTVATIVATLGAVFPEVEVWQTHRLDLVLVASRKPFTHEATALRARMASEPFATALRVAWRATSLEDVLARFVAGPALTKSLEGKRGLNTDDRSPVEFSFARTLSAGGLFEVATLRGRAAAMGADRPVVRGDVDWERVVRQRLAIATLAGETATADAGDPRAPAAAGDAGDPRARAHALYARGQLAAAVAAFRAQPVPPQGPVETALFAEGLADAGDPAAVAFIQGLREVQPTEAEAVTARLAFRMGQAEVARDALVAALVHYRSDPWPSQVSMARALDLVEEMATAQPALAPLFYDALAEPFAVAALEHPRRGMRVRLTSLGVPHRCQEAFAALEPHVPWREDVLRYRASCYSARRDPLLRQAKADLEAFQAAAKAARP